METLRAYVFKDSQEPFTQLLGENNIEYYYVAFNSFGPVNAGEALAIIKTIGDAAFWPSLATVIIAFIRARKSRKVIIQTKDNQIFHAEGFNVQEISKLLEEAKNITVIDTKSNSNQANSSSKK